MNLTAIASAIADRFAAAAITPPTGYTDPGTAVWQMPAAIATTPMAIVFPPEGDFSHWAHSRTADLDYPVRWYIAPAESERATKAMYDWAGTLISQLELNYDLDLSPTVTHAVVTGVRFGKLEYAGIEFYGVEVPVRVHVAEAFTPST